jgi:hydroxymethylpyrimidine kinase/phosphomethylpyrimidine kinase
MPVVKVLVIAGSDSGGGAGIQADIKAVAALGGHAATVITALTAQNTLGVQGIFPVPLDFVAQQFESVRLDIGMHALKTGMLHSPELVELVADLLRTVPAPKVIDPVMVAKGGAPLLLKEAVAAIKQKLLPLADLLTPNLDEARILLGGAIDDERRMIEAAKELRALGAKAVLIKGGHLSGDPMDVLFDGREIYKFSAPRIITPHTHGTGCTLASACACLLGQNTALPQAVEKARQLVRHGIQHGLALGAGHGPLQVLAP